MLAVMQWNLYAATNALPKDNNAQPVPNNLPPNATSVSTAEANPLNLNPINNLPSPDVFFSNHDQPLIWPSERHRITLGGIPIIDEHGKDTPNRLVNLGSYPGKGLSLPTLTVTELLGGTILQSLTRNGVNIEQALSTMEWTQGANGEVRASGAEASTLARVIYLALLKFESMQSALEAPERMEVALRRLYALIFVESSICLRSATHAQALRVAITILETYQSTQNLIPKL